MSQSDLKKLNGGFVKKLQDKLKDQSIEFRASEDITKGFTISFDSGKSSYDFSDESLAQYLTSFLNDQISALVKDSVNGNSK